MPKTKQSSKINSPSELFPPVITVLGHVDHGKTSLLDAIRKTTIAEREHGGITQRIGASRIEIMHEGKTHAITFIDTPGHEAFSKMRSRGAMAADIGLLIVSSIDGVMPQTEESINLLKESKIPFIVVLTKADMPTKNIEKVKQQLLKKEVLLEGLGGDIPYIEVSAKENLNIKELLDLILLVWELQEEKRASLSATHPFQAIVIESRLDTKVGPRATIVVKNGSIFLRDEVISEEVAGRVRTLINPEGKQVGSITVGEAAEILGFQTNPPVGALVEKKGDREKVKEVEEEQIPGSAGFPQFVDQGKLAIVLCADTQGSLEAIIYSLPTDQLTVTLQKTGEVSESDILFAKSTGSIILSFNTKIRNEVAQLAYLEKVLLKNYPIIYELLNEIRDVLEGKALALQEKILGKAQVLARFPFEKTFVSGVRVVEGRIAKGDRVRLMRGEEIIGESTISSLRHGKDTISKLEKGQEAGVIMSPFLDFTIGDVLICHG